MPTAIEVALVCALAAGGLLLARWRQNDERWRRARFGVVGTTATIVTFLSAYLWVFQRGRCSSRAHVACMLNTNQGSLTFLALLFAGVGIWTAAIGHWAEEKRERAAELDATRQALVAATDEASHNLMHVGSSWHDDGWHGFFPQLTVSAVPLLLEPEYRKHLHRDVVEQADAITRNWSALRDIEPGWKAPPDSYEPTDPPNRFDDFVSRSVMLLAMALTYHPTWCHSRLAEPRLKVLRQAAGQRHFAFAFLTSEFQDEAADLRVNDTPILAWWDDEPIVDVRTYAVGPAFRDLAVGHRH
jgi:putative flippase GtrA